MNDSRPRARPPLVLIANSQEWHSRSIESVLSPQGYAVLRAYTGKQAIERALEAMPDVIFVDSDLPDIDGFEVCRQLRAQPTISDCTPILMTSPGHPSRQKRLDALRAGAWEYIGAAVDGEELPLRLSALVRAKQEADRIREVGLLDELTGLYNLRGLARRARELGSQAFRQRDAFAVIVLSPVPTSGGPDASSNTVDRIARLLRETGRTSDAIGTLGPREFAIVAQGTDDRGAIRFAERLAKAVATIADSEGVQLAIGYDAVANFCDSPMDPTDMLSRAASAMRRSQVETVAGRGSHIRRFSAELN
jgi:diguanylate cyclase (GGDEF)-like protein